MYRYAVINSTTKQVVAVDESEYKIESPQHIQLQEGSYPVIGKTYTGAGGIASASDFRDPPRVEVLLNKKSTLSGVPIEIRVEHENLPEDVFMSIVHRHHGEVIFKTIKKDDAPFIKPYEFTAPGFYTITVFGLEPTIPTASNAFVVREAEDV